MNTDERKVITKESIKNELASKYKYLFIYKVVFLIIFTVMAIISTMSSSVVLIKIILYSLSSVVLCLVLYDLIFYLYVIKNKSFDIIEDTLISIDHDVLAFSARENGFDSSLKHKLTFKKSGAVYVSYKNYSFTVGDNFYLIMSRLYNKKLLALYNARSYVYKEH